MNCELCEKSADRLQWDYLGEIQICDSCKESERWYLRKTGVDYFS